MKRKLVFTITIIAFLACAIYLTQPAKADDSITVYATTLHYGYVTTIDYDVNVVEYYGSLHLTLTDPNSVVLFDDNIDTPYAGDWEYIGSIDVYGSYAAGDFTLDFSITGIGTFGDVSATASYTYYYYITVNDAYGATYGSEWCAQGSNSDVFAPTTPYGGDSTYRYRCYGYSIDGGSNIVGTSYQFTDIQEDHALTFNWLIQYYLTVNNGGHATASGYGWYDNGATAYASLDSGTVNGITGTRYAFASWSTGGTNYAQSAGITMNSAKSTTASWTTQYYLTITSSYGSPTGAGWYDSGATANFAVTTPVSGGSGIQYVFSTWSGSGTGSYSGSTVSASCTMNAPITEIASWTTQYYLTVTSAYGTPSGAGWYNSGSTAYASLNTGTSGAHTFDYWANDATGSNYAQSAPITMSSAKTATAVWGTIPTYYITSWSSSGGTIDPLGSTGILQGGSQQFNMTANTGYELSEVYINYVLTDLGGATTFTFNNLQSNQTIYAVFAEIPTGDSGTGVFGIGQFSAPLIVTPSNSFVLNAIANINTTYNDIANVSITLTHGTTLTWTNLDVFAATGTYVTFISGASTPLNSTAIRLSWTIKLSATMPNGYVSVTNAEIFNTLDELATNTQSNLFTFFAVPSGDNSGGGGGGGNKQPSQNNTVYLSTVPTEAPLTPQTPVAAEGVILIVAIIAVVIIVGVVRSKSTQKMWKEKRNLAPI